MRKIILVIFLLIIVVKTTTALENCENILDIDDRLICEKNNNLKCNTFRQYCNEDYSDNPEKNLYCVQVNEESYLCCHLTEEGSYDCEEKQTCQSKGQSCDGAGWNNQELNLICDTANGLCCEQTDDGLSCEDEYYDPNKVLTNIAVTNGKLHLCGKHYDLASLDAVEGNPSDITEMHGLCNEITTYKGELICVVRETGWEWISKDDGVPQMPGGSPQVREWLEKANSYDTSYSQQDIDAGIVCVDGQPTKAIKKNYPPRPTPGQGLCSEKLCADIQGNQPVCVPIGTSSGQDNFYTCVDVDGVARWQSKVSHLAELMIDRYDSEDYILHCAPNLDLNNLGVNQENDFEQAYCELIILKTSSSGRDEAKEVVVGVMLEELNTDSLKDVFEIVRDYHDDLPEITSDNIQDIQAVQQALSDARIDYLVIQENLNSVFFTSGDKLKQPSNNPLGRLWSMLYNFFALRLDKTQPEIVSDVAEQLFIYKKGSLTNTYVVEYSETPCAPNERRWILTGDTKECYDIRKWRRIIQNRGLV